MPRKQIKTPSIVKPSGVGKRTKIIIPQPTYRPVQLRKRDVVKKEEISDDVWWFTVHRRGLRRPVIGEDPLEARAVPHSKIAGTLPERIIYKYLTEILGFRAGIDFDFQSSMEGGRLELGGIVADFMFPFLKIILNPLGPTHATFLRHAKDEEQITDLRGMGFEVFMIEEEDVYNEYTFEEIMRRIFALPNGRTGSSGAYGGHEGDPLWYERLYYMAQRVYADLRRQTGI